MLTVATHDGSFHADDVFAYAILCLAHPNDDISLVRTRKPDILATADIVFDVGGAGYDHHMSDDMGKPYRDDERTRPFSSAGLIWRDFGKMVIENLIGSHSYNDDIHSYIDECLIWPIDANDNGITLGSNSDLSIIHMISLENPSWAIGYKQDRVLEDAHFVDAANMVKRFLTNKIMKSYSSKEAEVEILRVYENSTDKRVLILEDDIPWRSAIEKNHLDEILYCVFSDGNQWRITCVNIPDTQFGNKKPLPSSWGGLTDKLPEISGVPDATFCHPARFTCGAKSYEGIMNMVEIALNNEE